MKIDKIDSRQLSYKGFFPTLREQQVEEENPYAYRDDLIKPLPPEGHLVKTTLLNAPKHVFDGFVYDLKSIKHGFDGSANDHELGKLNNVGLITGGTALATYLATRKHAPSSKAMEFVGIGSFLASMAIWPAIAIQLPTRLIHGFNVRQHYKDSMNREKMVFNDPQYIPWDLYSEEEIYKVGDRMGVPRDMNNRRDYIQNKMKKIATQDNTLWMLSAGFAVPIMSALICNQAEQPVRNLCGYIRSQQNKKILTKALEAKYDPETSDMYKRLDSLLQLNNGKSLDEKLVGQICEIVSYDSNPMVDRALQTDLRAMLTSKKSVIEPQDGTRMLKTLKKSLAQVLGNESPAVGALVPELEELSGWLMEGGFVNRDLAKGDFIKLNRLISQKIGAKLEVYNSALPMSERISKETILAALNNKISARSTVNKFRVNNPSLTLDGPIQTTLRTLVKELATVDKKSGILKDYVFKDVSAAEETRLANFWNNSMNEIFNTLNIPWKDMDKARGDRDLMYGVLRSSMDRIAADPSEYEKVMAKLAKIVERMEKFDDVVSDKGDATVFEQTINKVLNPAADKLKGMGFADTAHALAGDAGASEGAILKSYAGHRLLGVKSTLFRIISTLDMHHRVATLTNIGGVTGQGLCREVQEEIVELSKRTSLFAHRSDFATKFFFSGNPHPNYADTSNITVEQGRVVNKYYRAGREGYREVAADTTLYRTSMGLMYGEALHPKTSSILGDKLAGQVAKYRREALSCFGDEYYFIRPGSFVSELEGKPNYMRPNHSKASNKFKFLMTGVSMDDLALKFANQKHNQRAWMKLFGGMGLGIFALTVGAQFFFGKTPKPTEQIQA